MPDYINMVSKSTKKKGWAYKEKKALKKIILYANEKPGKFFIIYRF